MPSENETSLRVVGSDEAGLISGDRLYQQLALFPMVPGEGDPPHGPWPCEVEPFTPVAATESTEESLWLASLRLLGLVNRHCRVITPA